MIWGGKNHYFWFNTHIYPIYNPAYCDATYGDPVDFCGIHVGKYTSPMDPMGSNTPKQQSHFELMGFTMFCPPGN